MRAVAFLALLLLAAAPVPPLEQEHLAADADSAWVAFELTPANQIRFHMRVNDMPVTAILDTGVSASVVSRRFAAAAGLRVRPGSGATAVGGNVPIGWVDTGSIALGSLSRSGGRIAVADLPAAATGDVPVDMLAGRDLTGGYALDIDYAARRFRLLPSGRLPFRGATAPLTIGGTWPIYVSELSIDGRRVGRIAVDTGDGGAITLSGEAWRTFAPAAPVTTTIAYGLGGVAVTGLAIVPGISAGDLAARDVPVAIESVGGFSQAIGMAGRMGSGFLRQYRVLLDPGAGHMVLGEAGAMPEPVRSTSGLLMQRAGDRLRVLHVMRGGPAERDGWHTGESICSVDGRALDDSGATTDWAIGVPGRTVALGLCGGAIRRLTLRRFY